MKLNHASLFSGIGASELAAEWMKWNNVFHCEIEPFPRKILNYYWSKSISYENIKQTDFTIHRGKIDILTGGFPCQPYSVVGKQLGKYDERHLWPEMLRAIKEIQPRWVVAENVRGIVNWSKGLVFEEVQTDLEAQGYEVQSFILPAASVNAPHRRDRVFFIAHSESFGRSSSFGKTTDNNQRKTKKYKPKRSKIRNRNKAISRTRFSANTCILRQFNRNNYWKKRHLCNNKYRNAKKDKPTRNRWKCRISSFGKINRFKSFTNTTSFRRRKVLQNIQSKFSDGKSFNSNYEQNYWEKFPTQSPICNGNDGLPSKLDTITFPKWRTESVKAGGNAIVPQLMFQIFKTIENYEKT